MSMSMKKMMIGGMLVAGALSAENPCNLVDCPPEKSVCVVEAGVPTCVVQKFEFPTGCKSGQVFEGSSGSLDYPAGSGKYSNNEAACFYFKCIGKRASLQWKAFSTEQGFDFVSATAVTNGAVGATLLSKHSGSTVPAPTTVEGADGIFMYLTSDYSVRASGFELDWTCHEPLSLGDVCYQFCEDGSCAPVNKREACPADASCLSSSALLGFNSHHTCQLKAGSVCYQFCENPADCAPVNLREHCAVGTECKDATTGFGFNSKHTCQEVLAAGATCYQFCENPATCVAIDKRDQCAKGTVCKDDGAIGFDSHHTCQAEEEEELLSVGEVCYRFCEGGSSCVPVSKRDQCASGSECKPTGAIGFNSESTCQAVLSVGEICYRFCEGGSGCVFVDKRDECASGTECKSTGVIGFNSEKSCQAVLAAGEVCYQFCEDGSCAPINKRDQCASGTSCVASSSMPSFNSLETCVLSQ
eukprot:TRINITY_DN38_c0_g1_i5.p1 TRINITY_DN38_c0_g1~~TRINITY_DN38_c0_g1_i5.p1  ORF type:complete len:471 (+),score=80.21 TRINITY_DN38_c0_g1_i5:65-1477(+)